MLSGPRPPAPVEDEEHEPHYGHEDESAEVELRHGCQPEKGEGQVDGATAADNGGEQAAQQERGKERDGVRIPDEAPIGDGPGIYGEEKAGQERHGPAEEGGYVEIQGEDGPDAEQRLEAYGREDGWAHHEREADEVLDQRWVHDAGRRFICG